MKVDAQLPKEEKGVCVFVFVFVFVCVCVRARGAIVYRAMEGAGLGRWHSV
jgi:hypothetical protein